MNIPNKDNPSRQPHRITDPATLEARLRADARASRVSVPSGLEISIAAAVRRDAARGREHREVQERRARRWFSPAFAGLVTSACAVAAVVFWNNYADQRADRAAEIQYLVDSVQSLPSRLASAELPVARRIASSDPLAREITSVRNDARSALDFLAANFLPSQALSRSNEIPDRLPPQET